VEERVVTLSHTNTQYRISTIILVLCCIIVSGCQVYRYDYMVREEGVREQKLLLQRQARWWVEDVWCVWKWGRAKRKRPKLLRSIKRSLPRRNWPCLWPRTLLSRLHSASYQRHVSRRSASWHRHPSPSIWHLRFWLYFRRLRWGSLP